MILPLDLIGLKHRKRVFGTQQGGQSWLSTNTVTGINQAGNTEVLIPYEETWDQNNHWWEWQRALRSLRREGRFDMTDDENRRWVDGLSLEDVGGAFYNKKEKIFNANQRFNLRSINGDRTYSGPLEAYTVTNANLRGFSDTAPFSDGFGDASGLLDLDKYGATAIKRCQPINPHSSAFNAVGELYRDGLPKIPGSILRQHQQGSNDLEYLGGGAEEYLNLEFGVRPTIADMRDLYNATRKMKSILEQYHRDSGRAVRRNYRFKEEKSTTTSENSGYYPAGPGPGLDGTLWIRPGWRRVTVTTTTNRWFSGSFTYYAKPDEKGLAKARDIMREFELTYGLAPTADALWNLQPYSWLADWVTNTGDVLRNMTAFSADGLIMNYGYIMEHRVREVEFYLSGAQARNGTGTVDVNLSQRFVQETKRRRRATPFGFGLDSGSFTTRQWAILAALGITRGSSTAR